MERHCKRLDASGHDHRALVVPLAKLPRRTTVMATSPRAALTTFCEERGWHTFFLPPLVDIGQPLDGVIYSGDRRERAAVTVQAVQVQRERTDGARRIFSYPGIYRIEVRHG